MEAKKFKVGQIIKYRNGSETIYEGMIKMITERPTLIVIDHTNSASVELWDAGYAIGSEIKLQQVVS